MRSRIQNPYCYDAINYIQFYMNKIEFHRNSISYCPSLGCRRKWMCIVFSRHSNLTRYGTLFKHYVWQTTYILFHTNYLQTGIDRNWDCIESLDVTIQSLYKLYRNFRNYSIITYRNSIEILYKMYKKLFTNSIQTV